MLTFSRNSAIIYLSKEREVNKMIVIKWNRNYIMEWLWFKFIPKDYSKKTKKGVDKN